MRSLSVGGYLAEVHTAISRTGWRVLLLLPGWFVLPFLVQSLLHPLDVVKADHVIHGLPLPHTATAQQLTVSVTEVLVIGAAICMWQLIASVAFYRKAQVFGRSPPFWWAASVILRGSSASAAR
jgi:hypothetical protein